MNLALCLIFLQLCFIISNTATKQSVKHYVLNSISDDRKLDKPTHVTFLRFHPNNGADPWKVYIKPTWKPNGKHTLITEENAMQEEKDVLNGKVLRAATVIYKANSTLQKFTSKVWEALEKSGNFTIQHITEGVDIIGSFNETSKTWNGAIGLLLNNQADITGNLCIRGPQRRDDFDISISVVTTKMCLYIKKPSNKVILERSGYLRPFTIEVWCGMLLLLFAVTALITLTKIKVVKELDYGRYIPQTFLHLWGILCQLGLSDFPRTSSRRMVYYAMFFFSYFIYAIYSSLLLSEIVNVQDGLPFSSMEEFVANKFYKLGVVKSSPFHQNVLEMRYDPFEKMQRKLLKDVDLPTSVEYLVDRVCREKIAGAIYEMYMESIQIRGKPKCSLVYICFTSRPSIDLYFAFPKNSPYLRAINYNILKLKNVGLLDGIYKSVYDVEKPLSTKEDLEVTYTGVALSDILTLLLISLGSFILSLFVLLLEMVYFRFYEKQTVAIRIEPRRPVAASIRKRHILA